MSAGLVSQLSRYSCALTHGQYAVLSEDSANVPRAWIRVFALSLQDGSHKVGVPQVRVKACFRVVLDDAVEDELLEEGLRGPVRREVLVLLLLALLARLLLALLPLLADFPLLSLVSLRCLEGILWLTEKITIYHHSQS